MEKKLFEVVVVDTTNDAILIDAKVMATDEQNAILKACHGMVWNKEDSVVMVRPFRGK